MSEYVTESVETLHHELQAHAFIAHAGAYGLEGCACGWRRDGWDAQTHEAHVAAALIASGAVRPAVEVRAEALREVVERVDAALQSTHGSGVWVVRGAAAGAVASLRGLAAALAEEVGDRG